jgi:hypothetical protein
MKFRKHTAQNDAQRTGASCFKILYFLGDGDFVASIETTDTLGGNLGCVIDNYLREKKYGCLGFLHNVIIS